MIDHPEGQRSAGPGQPWRRPRPEAGGPPPPAPPPAERRAHEPLREEDIPTREPGTRLDLAERLERDAEVAARLHTTGSNRRAADLREAAALARASAPSKARVEDRHERACAEVEAYGDGWAAGHEQGYADGVADAERGEVRTDYAQSMAKRDVPSDPGLAYDSLETDEEKDGANAESRRVEALVEAVTPILSAYRSTDAHITEEQITEAWTALEEVRDR